MLESIICFQDEYGKAYASHVSHYRPFLTVFLLDYPLDILRKVGITSLSEFDKDIQTLERPKASMASLAFMRFLGISGLNSFGC